MFGIGEDPFQGQQGPGPLGDLQNQVAGVLNGADQNHVYLPTGPGNPIITLPRPQAGYWAAGYRPAAPVYNGPRGQAAVVFLLVVVAVLVGVVIVLALR